MDSFVEVLRGGADGFIDYLSAHVITCLVPALFIGGAIAVFISQASVLWYFGPKANRVFSCGVASVSGAVLAVCSCTVLPLLGSIYKRGASHDLRIRLRADRGIERQEEGHEHQGAWTGLCPVPSAGAVG